MLGLGAVIQPMLAVPAVVLILILALSYPSEAGDRARRLGRAATLFAAISATVGLARFARSKAMLGMVEGGQTVAVQSALYRLREIVLAEDALRKSASWDPDGDHVGSAVLIQGLMGGAPLRPGNGPSAPFLNYLFHESMDTATGPSAKVEGYLYIVCLPTPDGRLTALPKTPVDDELAERRFVAYAWPSDSAAGVNTAFFVDEHERILLLAPPRGTPAPFLGAQHSPPCDAAIGADAPRWKVWKNKQPRKSLPGDPSQPSP
jgi:hypothetical protein